MNLPGILARRAGQYAIIRIADKKQLSILAAAPELLEALIESTAMMETHDKIRKSCEKIKTLSIKHWGNDKNIKHNREMRAIEFRGETKTGKWLYGDLVQWKDVGGCAITPQKGGMTDYNKFEVIPTYSCFGLYIDGVFAGGVTADEIDLNNSLFKNNNLEVIGNIHDNKDLLIWIMVG